MVCFESKQSLKSLKCDYKYKFVHTNVFLQYVPIVNRVYLCRRKIFFLPMNFKTTSLKTKNSPSNKNIPRLFLKKWLNGKSSKICFFIQGTVFQNILTWAQKADIKPRGCMAAAALHIVVAGTHPAWTGNSLLANLTHK